MLSISYLPAENCSVEFQGVLVGKISENRAELFVGSREATTAFFKKFGGTFRISGKPVDIAFVALHHSENILELTDSFGIRHIGHGLKFWFII